MDLSILVPARNEEFLKNTIDDLLAHCESDFEILVGLDGAWPFDPIPDHPRLTLLHFPESVGQRGITNRLAAIASGKYFIKVDAHCAFEQGFDKKLLVVADKGLALVPNMKNLHAFDWVCACGWRKYQGPTPESCPQCGGKDVYKDVLWRAKPSPNSKSFCFDPTPHFQYFGDWNKRPEGKGNLTETMSLQGSFFMVHRETYFDLNLCDESFGSWGSQGIEVACKLWLSGGRVLCLQNAWYGHMFRTQGSDFGFPYPLSGNQVERAKKRARELFFEGKWDKMTRPLSWLVEKFWPIQNYWSEEDLLNLKTLERGRW